MNSVVPAPPPATVAAYLRVSSQVQRQRETIASQRDGVLEYAGTRGWIIPNERVFADDGFSGATLDRPALEALRDVVASGEVDTVLVWSVDRLSRNFAYQILLQEEFARAGAQVVFVQEPDDATPQGMLLRQMLSVISEYERTQIAERSRRGKLHRARQGSLNMITRAPYGYRLIPKTEACGARLEIDDAEAGVVRRIYDLYLREGLKMNAISRRLDAEAVRPRHAARWSTSTVAVILRNEAYIGKAAYLKTASTGQRARPNRIGRQRAGAVRRLVGRTVRPREEWIELAIPAILDETTFARAQQRRADNRRFSPRKTTVATLLQGLCVCAHCGYAMGRHSGTGGRSRPRLHYYRCHGIDSWRRAEGAVCDNPPVRADELDDAVWNEVLALLENPQLIESEINRRLAATNDTTSAGRRMEALRDALSRNKTQRRRLLDAYQADLLTLDELRERNGPLQTQQRSILSEIKAVHAFELDRESQLSLVSTVEQFLTRMREGAHSLSLAERQRIVRLLIREVRIGKESVTICHSIPVGSVPPRGSDSSRAASSPMSRDREEFLIPRCGQVVQHKRVVVQMTLGQALFDTALAAHQPVHRLVQLVFVHFAEVKDVAEGGHGALGMKGAGGGELGAGVDDAGDDHGGDHLTQAAGASGEEGVEIELFEGAEDGGDVAMRAAAQAGEGVLGIEEGFAFEGSSDEIDNVCGEVGDVAEGLVLDLAVFSEGSAQEMGVVGLVFVAACSCGYVDRACSAWHQGQDTTKGPEWQHL